MSCSANETACIVTSIPGPRGDDGADGTNGTDGVNAFTLLTAGFAMPAELGSVVTTVDDNRWMVVGQLVYVQGAGYMRVDTVDIDGTTVTLTNLEDTATGAYAGNAPPTTAIPAQGKVSPGGMQGPTGTVGAEGDPGDPGNPGTPGAPGSNAFTATTADFIQPGVGLTVNIAVEDSQWAGIGEPVQVIGAGWYLVTAVPDDTHITLQNLGYTGSVTPGTNVPDPVKVTPSGLIGPAGAAGDTGPAGTLANYFLANKDGVNQTVTDNLATKVTFPNEAFDASGVWNSTTSKYTAPATGVYFFAFAVELLAPSAGGVITASLYKNGGSGIGLEVCRAAGQWATSVEPISAIGSIILALNAADTIEVSVHQVSGAGQTVDGANAPTYICGFRLA